MKLWMSSEAWVDVASQLAKASNQIEQIFNSTLTNKDYGEGVRQWAVIIILLPPDMHQQYPERFKYHKSDRSVEFRLRIDLESFKAGDEATHRRLICEVLRRSLDMLATKKVPDFDHPRLKHDVQTLCKEQGWLS